MQVCLVTAADARHRVADAIRAALPEAEVRTLRCSRLAPLRQAYRTASVGVVACADAEPAAALAQRLSRVRWVRVLADHEVAQAGTCAGRTPSPAAAALAVSRARLEEARRRWPAARVAALEDRDGLGRVLRDLALAPAARRPAPPATAFVADAWTFLNDRATRLSIRLLPRAGKAPRPIHPKHLVPAPWHHWYLDELRPSDRVLDLGCANGVHTVAAAGVAASVVGVDLDAGQLDAARARARAAGAANVELVLGDLADPAVVRRLGRFDAVLALDVLEHLADREALLRAVRAVLRPGGRLVVAVPNRTTPYRRWLYRMGGFSFSDGDHKVEYTEEELRAELARAGFELRRLQRAVYDSPFAGVSTLLAVVSVRAYAALSRRRERLGRERPGSAIALRAVFAAAAQEDAAGPAATRR